MAQYEEAIRMAYRVEQGADPELLVAEAAGAHQSPVQPAAAGSKPKRQTKRGRDGNKSDGQGNESGERAWPSRADYMRERRQQQRKEKNMTEAKVGAVGRLSRSAGPGWRKPLRAARRRPGGVCAVIIGAAVQCCGREVPPLLTIPPDAP